MHQFTDQEAMELATTLALKGLGWVEPNPPVGCVVLNKNRQLLSCGYHRRFGHHHAEIDALKKIRNINDLKGAHVYVTLEPCAHFGKTPPCAHTLAQLPIRSVTYGLKDPNPLVSGRGIEILRKAKKQVRQFQGNKAKLLELIDAFSFAHKRKMSFITLKIASSLDGQMALKSGQSQWITGKAARNYGHLLRARHTAVLIGKNTLLIDNPRLDIRLPRLRHFRKNNFVVILDPAGEVLDKIHKFNIAKARDKNAIWVVTGPKVKVRNPYCRHLKIQLMKGQFDLAHLRSELFDQGIQSVLVEGGAETLSQFIAQNQANKLCLFLAPSIIGAVNGLSWTQSIVTKDLANKQELTNMSYEFLNPDFLLTAYFKKGLQ